MSEEKLESARTFAPKLIASTGEDYNYLKRSQAESNSGNSTATASLSPPCNDSETTLRAPSDAGIFKSAHLYVRACLFTHDIVLYTSRN